MGANIIYNRYRLSKVMFGVEFTIKQCQKSMPHLRDQANKEAAKKLYKKKKSPFYKSKTKKRPSKTLYNLMNQQSLPKLKDNEQMTCKAFPSLDGIQSQIEMFNISKNYDNRSNDNEKTLMSESDGNGKLEIDSESESESSFDSSDSDLIADLEENHPELVEKRRNN